MDRKQYFIFQDEHHLFDEYTVKLVNKLISQHVFDEILSEISVGKEAVVYKAKQKEEIIALKIFRVKSCNFNKMYEYISQDHRFSIAIKNRRKIILEWVKREFKNQLLAYQNNVSVPRPILQREYVIAMEFIGDELPARQLKNKYPDDPEQFYKEVIDNYRRLVLDAKIVHGDLSEFNILNYNEHPIFIDFSQGTDVASVLGIQLLRRDLEKIGNFFKKFIDPKIDLIYDDLISELKKRKILY
ncbi:MAG: RIO1 family regulatory kinase/ATPase [Candidatus Woesearchaeota archaeon]